MVVPELWACMPFPRLGHRKPTSSLATRSSERSGGYASVGEHGSRCKSGDVAEEEVG
jgi:hypothetical protein